MISEIPFNPHAIEILNFTNATMIIQNCLFSKFFENIFHHPNLIEEHKLQLLKFLGKIRYNESRPTAWGVRTKLNLPEARYHK